MYTRFSIHVCTFLINLTVINCIFLSVFRNIVTAIIISIYPLTLLLSKLRSFSYKTFSRNFTTNTDIREQIHGNII